MHIVSSSFLGLGFVQLALYLVTAFSFYKLANIRRIPNAWLAFIPFFQLYVVGYIGDTLKYNTAPFNRYLSDIPLAYALPLLSILSGVVGIFPLIGFLGSSLLSLLVFVGEVLVYLFVFEQYAPQNKFLFTVLSLIPVVGPCLILYSIRDYH